MVNCCRSVSCVLAVLPEFARIQPGDLAAAPCDFPDHVVAAPSRSKAKRKQSRPFEIVRRVRMKRRAGVPGDPGCRSCRRRSGKPCPANSGPASVAACHRPAIVRRHASRRMALRRRAPGGPPDGRIGARSRCGPTTLQAHRRNARARRRRPCRHRPDCCRSAWRQEHSGSCAPLCWRLGDREQEPKMLAARRLPAGCALFLTAER
jgi:hypothetical protein